MIGSILQSPAPVQEGADTRSKRKLTEEQAQVLSEKTLESLSEKGWCLWRCNDVLHGDVILVVDEQMKKEGLVNGIPQGYPVYTLAELAGLIGASDSTVRLIHEAKKTAGAEIVTRR